MQFLWIAAAHKTLALRSYKIVPRGDAHPISIAPMTIDLIRAIDAWKKAVAEAQAAEKLLDHTWHHHLDGRGPAPTGGLVNEVAQFRARAQTRLAAAMALMRSIGDEGPLTAVPIADREPLDAQ